MQTTHYFQSTCQVLTRAFKAVIFLILFVGASAVFAQNVTITPNGITPNQSGAVSRLSYDGIIALPSPKNGDMAYDLTFSCLRIYQKNKWLKVLTEANLQKPSLMGWRAGGVKTESGNAIAVDADGNVYVAGFFSEAAIFDTTTISTTKYGIFLAKYTNTGHLLWIQKAATNSTSISVNNMALDANGNIYLTGYFLVDATFGPINFTASGSRDIFVAKYNTTGDLIFAQKAGGSDTDESTSVAVDADGAVYITGYFSGTARLGNFDYISAGGTDVFLLKYSTDGIFSWVQTDGGIGNDKANGIAIDSDGSVFLTGSYSQTATFGSVTFSSKGNTDIFLAKYSADGVAGWAKSMGGTGNDESNDIAIDSNNKLYIIGSFEGSATFSLTPLTSAGLLDIFVTKYSSAGVLEWIIREGGTVSEVPKTINVDSNGNVYIVAEFSTATTFGNNAFNTTGGIDFIIAKYTTNGLFIWAEKVGGNSVDHCLNATVDPLGNVYATGYFQSEIPIGYDTFTSAGQADMFVVRVRD